MKTLRQSLLLSFLFLSIFATAQVPVMNSYPAATSVVFLDFDGHVVEGTSWNASGPIVCGAATLDAAQITAVFNRVAEDYRPFTVNVTTDSTKYTAAPASRRMRVVLTVSSSWYGSAGGVAYLNSFKWGDNTPCFVFTALLNNNVKYIAEAASHEVGHTLGLRHQSSYDAVCNKTGEYHSGIGNGEISWAPIMGVGYYKNMTLWHDGANPYGCNSYQDDLDMIVNNGNDITFRADDFGNTTSNAAGAVFAGNRLSVEGIVERPGDVDAFSFTTTSAGWFSLAALPFSVASGNTGANIHLQVELLNQSGRVLGVYNAESSLNVSIDTALPAGTYYLRVQGRGNVYAPDYASLGAYTLTATTSPNTPLPLYKLQLSGATTGNQHNLRWEVVADEKIVAQTLEVSADGTRFQSLASPEPNARLFTNNAASDNIQYYRIQVVLETGRRHFSNTIALRSKGAAPRPSLVGNTTTGLLTVSSPGAFAYAITDFSGRLLARGTLVQGLNVLTPSLPTSGLYLIRFSNATGQYTEKFSKQ